LFGPGDASESVELEIVPQGTLAEPDRLISHDLMQAHGGAARGRLQSLID
jgi:hypothetical protein